MQRTEIQIETADRLVTDVTEEVHAFCRDKGDGLVHVFAPHATAGLALMELGSGSERDLARFLDELLPRDDRYSHRHGSAGHGADHLLPAVISPSLVLVVDGGELHLGTWQSIAFIDPNHDNAIRRLELSFLQG